MVTRLALGPPVLAFAVPVAPMAPEPLVPDESTPVKLITVIEEITLFESVAVTVTLLSGDAANALHISAVPLWTFVRLTSTHVSPVLVIFVTVVLVPLR